MRALAAILIVVVSSCCSHAHRPTSARGITASLRNYLDCTWSLGVTKCINALSVWRAERAINHPGSKQKLIEDIKQFPWNQYRNTTEYQLNSKLCEETEKILRRQSLSLTMVPGFRFELRSKGNGTLNFDVYKNTNARAGRSVKKAKKAFYKIVPFLLVPGLLMAAILPFFLPALKFLTLGAVMLNNMALSGAIFTLLRNNAFNDRYEHKIIYTNEGYKNEKHAKFSHNQNHDVIDSELYYPENQAVEYVEDEMNPIESIPLSPDWSEPNYSFSKFTKRKSKILVHNN